MWDFSFGRAIAMALRTLPFILLRLAVYALISFSYLAAVGSGAGIGWLLGRVASVEGAAGGAFWGALIAFGLTTAILYLLREYLLYMVKAAHIAVLVELLDGKSVPDGQNQLSYGTATVKAHFVESSVLFGVDQLIKGVIAAIAGLMQGVANMLPIPALQTLIGLINAVMRMSLTYVDEIILAQLLRSRTVNPWETAQDALVLYAQNYQHMLKNAAWLTLLIWLATFGLFLVFLSPAAGLLAMFPRAASVWAFLIALLFAWALKKAVMEPIAIACLMQVFFATIAGQTPDPEWRARLEECSAMFRELGVKAAGWVGGQLSPKPAGA
jgi:hypothetical protein